MKKININTSSRYPVPRKEIVFFLDEKLQESQQDLGINVVFIGKRKMREIALTYKNEDESLPVLAFPYQGEDGLLGEIFICYPQAVLLAAERNRTVKDMLIWLLDHAFANLLKS